MRFEAIPSEYFRRFHASFHGDTEQTFAVCAKCGGACEFNKIGTLMPGEREYMAGVAGLSVDEFAGRYLDTIVLEDGRELDVLRLIKGCPFLDRGTFECNCRSYKVILCEIYPIGFHVAGEEVTFAIDDWCPLSETLRFRRHFLERGIPAIARLPVPAAWYRAVARYDDLHFDYDLLEAMRGDRNAPHAYTIDELLACQRAGLDNDPRERFHPYPAEVVAEVVQRRQRGGAPHEIEIDLSGLGRGGGSAA